MCEWPERPQVPWAFVVFLAAAGCVALQLRAGWVPGPGQAALLAAACAAALAAVRRIRPALVGRAAVAAAAVGLALVSGSLELASQARGRALLEGTPVSRLSLTTVSDAVEGTYGWSSEAEASLGGATVGTVRLRSDVPLGLRETVEGVGTFSAPGERDAAEMRGRGLLGTVRLSTVRSRAPAPGPLGAFARARASLLEGFGPDASEAHAVAAALALGWRGALRSTGVADTVSAAGVSHLVAVSGAHLSVVAALFGGVASRARPLWARTAVTGLLTGCFVLLCAAPASALRAWAMALASSASQVAGRRASPLAALGCFGWLLCCLDPTAVSDLGLSLSCTCVACLALFGPWARAALDRLVPAPRPRPRAGALARALSSVRSRCVSDLAAGLLCFAASAPMAASTFGTLSLAGPLCSMAAAPLFPALLASSLAAVALAAVPVAGAAADLAATGAASVLLGVCRAATAFPWAVLPVEVPGAVGAVAAVPAGAALLALWPRPRAAVLRRGAALALAATLVVGALPWLEPPSLEVLDVGQGDALLLRDGPRAVLVDCGPPGGGLAASLRSRGVASLDAVVLTHQHDDHYGGLGELDGSVAVGRLVVAEGVDASLCDGVASAADALGTPVRTVSAGDAVQVGGWRLEALWPEGPVDGTENAHSLCLLATHARGLRALLVGDAERGELSRFAPAAGRVDVLKLGHHGSEASLDRACIDALRPSLCVASAGAGNAYGHPDPVCVALVEGSGSRFLCTAEHGPVRVSADTSTGVRVSVGRPEALAA
ncbi:ComEC/Rec2 family competence protein [Caniella muris]|uniref:ComEC/Rec2 family competence protein n=1 Tax=Caniella muris TaxID=2941502 RepID=UPI00203C8A61|nr:ComEC/Rec2 family competence protein [Caniella muris]